MKKVALALFFILIFCCFISCGNDSSTESSAPSSLWDSATYKESTELGNGETQILVDVKAEGKTVTLTINTDKSTLGEALKELNLIEGENGLYTVVNGITADWNIDKSYWSLSVEGKTSMVGADTVELTNGGHYAWEKTK